MLILGKHGLPALFVVLDVELLSHRVANTNIHKMLQQFGLTVRCIESNTDVDKTQQPDVDKTQQPVVVLHIKTETL